MNVNPWSRPSPGAMLLIATLMTGGVSALAQEPQQFQGRPLVDALRALQARGLRIVFTSATVTSDLMVKSEPRAPSARAQLDELLAPHALVARDGPAGIIQIVRAAPVTAIRPAVALGAIEGHVVDATTGAALAGVVVRVDRLKTTDRTDGEGRFVLRVAPGTWNLHASAVNYIAATQRVEVDGQSAATVTLALSPASPQHNEYVSVVTTVPYRKDRGVASERTVDRSEMSRLTGSLADDPVRLIHAFPGATAADDFRTDFAVRGSPSRHLDVVIDGVSTQWLQHTAPGRGATGSVTMFASDLVDDVTLRTGAYPRRHGDYLGAQLELTLREGSRTDFKVRGSVGGTTAMLLAEGPLDRSARGSWLTAVRQSYLEWPTERDDSTRTAFGFSDAVARVVYDVRPSQQIALTWLGGISNVDGDDDDVPVSELGDGTNRLSLGSLAWRSELSAGGVIKQRAYVVRQDFVNRYQTGESSDRGAQRQLGYRIDFSRPVAGGLFEAGAQVARFSIDDLPRAADAQAIAGASWTRSAYAHFAWAATPALTLSPGARISASNLSPNHTVSRWLLAEWTFRPAWTLAGSAGVSEQLPELRHTLGADGSPLRPERAAHFDVAIEHRFAKAMRWQATAFSRREVDILREPEIHPRLLGDALVAPDRHFATALHGSSRGFELLIDRVSASGLAGWVSYAYGRTRSVDVPRNQTFWGDFDRRHTFTMFGVYNLSPRSRVGATLRTGSNLPIAAYLATRDGQLVVGAERNQVRLPVYARLDLRADREVEYFGRRLTLFAEVLNVLNRANAARANGSIDLVSGRAVGFSDSLARRRASAGIVFEF